MSSEQNITNSISSSIKSQSDINSSISNDKNNDNSSSNESSSINLVNSNDSDNYSSKINSLFSKLQSNSSSFNDSNSSSSTVPKSSSINNLGSNMIDDSSDVTYSDDDYLGKISSNASSASVYFNKINSVSSNIANSSANISSISNKINVLNEQIGLNQITIPTNEAVNKAAQSVAINIIKVNNQEIKALTAKNSISSMTFRVKFDYENYLKAKKAIKTDVSGINTHMSNSNIAFNQGINTLNSHNSLITSYANQLSLDISSASQGVNSASIAATNAVNNQDSALSIYNNVQSLASHLSQQIISTAQSNASAIKLTASEATNLSNSASDYNQQLASISRNYSDNSSIASASSAATPNLHTVDTDNQIISNTASSIIAKINQMDDTVDFMTLGTNYQRASKAANQTLAYKNTMANSIDNIVSATDIAKSVAKTLHAQRIALNNGANDYMPVADITSLDTENNTATYIKYYKKGYQNASRGFHKHVHQLLSNDTIKNNSSDSSYKIGFNNATQFVNGINDARKRVIKNDKEINSKHYNYGYNACRKLIHRSLLSKSRDAAISLKQALLLVLGFLIGSYK